MISRLQYITQDHSGKTHAQLCEEACKAGVKWVQLRMKDTSYETYLEEAKACREITKSYKATLIINDNLSIALESRADGVHLGLLDMPVREARLQSPDEFIIGGTANTIEDVERHIADGADYVGMGPYKYTTTKKKLSPILGLEGYQKALGQLSTRDFPIVAIGGITQNDIYQLKKIGMHGVAVSGLITHSADKHTMVEEINKAFEEQINLKVAD
ncbi:thiamine phosphate synthase [Fulvivirga sp. RKSG066]|uniref:thiamine phosphate synthase n=1 Tax=Fulvivirga aurantia TaxID=2529383 RepID=UPI0012BC0672|nr:thiamine phosphate synthase [Fulvivirga aurantia]MTI22060.1 thiamine phosphate synthase [Fulvivirga aurantia]